MANSARAAVRTAVFVLKVMPMLPSKALNFITPAVVVEELEYPTNEGTAVGQVYRPAGKGPYPAMVLCLGVVPFGVDHPQVPRLGEALSRAGFAALMYWSPAMRDFRLDPVDIEYIARTYDILLAQPYVDSRHSGLFGTCVGGSFALLASAQPSIRNKVAFVGAFAPYSSLTSLAIDVVTKTRFKGEGREPWQVDPLTRKVLIHSITAHLDPAESAILRLEPTSGGDACTRDGKAIERLLEAVTLEEASEALDGLPQDVRDGLSQISPVNCLNDILAPVIAISHDRDDNVIPVGQSRLLAERLHARSGVHYTEFALFQHADPTKRKLKPFELARQLTRFFLWLHGVFRQAVV
jgi:hypothetical protein